MRWLACALLIVGACADGGQRPSVATITSTDLAPEGYRSIAFAGSRDLPGYDRAIVAPDVRAMLRNAIRTELADRLGYELSDDPESAELIVIAGVGKRSINRDNGMRYTYVGDGALAPTVDIREFEAAVNEGALVIDVIERESFEPVWHGVVQGQYEKKVKEERVQDAIKRLMASFPPAAP